ncbi:MAG: HemK family protein methyltransferase, partial [Deltaproteobacteria bacterium]|nr:HemK family protein methyltransferase [Deltaproteobacteria bacterium]
TGSGVIAVVLAKETGERVVAIDISADALRVARTNDRRHAVPGTIDLIRADLFSPLLERQNFSLIVSNPPYVSRFDVCNSLEPEVAHFEPHIALDGGEKGVEIISRIREKLPLILKSGGEVFMEIGADQGDYVRQLFETGITGLPDFCRVEIRVDYGGRDRVLHAVLGS